MGIRLGMMLETTSSSCCRYLNNHRVAQRNLGCFVLRVYHIYDMCVSNRIGDRRRFAGSSISLAKRNAILADGKPMFKSHPQFIPIVMVGRLMVSSPTLHQVWTQWWTQPKSHGKWGLYGTPMASHSGISRFTPIRSTYPHRSWHDSMKDLPFFINFWRSEGCPVALQQTKMLEKSSLMISRNLSPMVCRNRC